MAYANTVIAQRRQFIGTDSRMGYAQSLLLEDAIDGVPNAGAINGAPNAGTINGVPNQLKELSWIDGLIRLSVDSVRLQGGPALASYVQALHDDEVVGFAFDEERVTEQTLSEAAFLHVLHGPHGRVQGTGRRQRDEKPRDERPRIRVACPLASSEAALIEWELIEDRPSGCMTPYHAPTHHFVDCSGHHEDYDTLLGHGQRNLADYVHVCTETRRRLTFLPVVRIPAGAVTDDFDEPAGRDRWAPAEDFPDPSVTIEFFGACAIRGCWGRPTDEVDPVFLAPAREIVPLLASHGYDLESSS